MQRCLELAKLGEGSASPNPMVGSVIVHNNKIIGEGYHQKCGEAHAEVNAINSVDNDELFEQSTIYVNLEPCSHFGKTPPCADLIINKKIPNVVIGCIDTFSKVSGNGIKKLEEAGCNVTVGVLERESKELNRRFFTFHKNKRPYITLKWAETKDGFISREVSITDREDNWISNNICKPLVHKLRANEDAIMVGTNTAKKDNPSLNTREWHGSNPIRIVLDKELRLDKALHLFDGKYKTLVFTSQKCSNTENIEYISIDFTKSIEIQILEELYDRKILSLIIEGGTKLIEGFLKQNLWDEAIIITGDKIFNEGIRAPRINGRIDDIFQIENDSIKTLYNNTK